MDRYPMRRRLVGIAMSGFSLAALAAGPGPAWGDGARPVTISPGGSRGCLAIQRASQSSGKSAVIADCHGKISQQWVRTTLKQLQVRHSGLCLTILDGNKKRGAPVIQGACATGRSKDQQWYVSAKGEIRSKLNHMCLTVSHGGSQITMDGCNGTPDQSWKLKPR